MFFLLAGFRLFVQCTGLTVSSLILKRAERRSGLTLIVILSLCTPALPAFALQCSCSFLETVPAILLTLSANGAGVHGFNEGAYEGALTVSF